ncbi:MAG: hypothetical protein CBB67_018015 [Alteromonadaceae bacterium TMED7]|nr:hypothetical protein [Alteromonadaceae bacterium]RPH15323.1 MAG: hypothetical protein CBB67_018015 [Alteromonadaceae bacterium TMED7]|tara:strand:+ start:9007 stop:12708 length:3702 start_codon:yes stop_codon:yes gene_type:complete
MVSINFEQWELQSSYKFSQDFALLTRSEGFATKRPVVYNGTVDTIIVKPNNTLPQIMGEKLDEMVWDDFVEICLTYKDSTDKKYSMWPFTRHPYVYEIADEICSSTDLQGQAFRTTLVGELKSRYDTYASTARALSQGKFKPTFINWTKSLQSFENPFECIKYLVLVIESGTTYFKETLRQRLDGLKIEDIEASPIFHFLTNCSHRTAKPYRTNLDPSLLFSAPREREALLRKAIQDDCLSPEGAARTAVSDFLYAVVQTVKNALNHILEMNFFDKAIFFPYHFSRHHLKSSGMALPATAQMTSLREWLIKTITPEDKQFNKVYYPNFQSLMFFGVASFDEIGDIPEDFFLNLTKAKRETKEYNTATGSFYKGYNVLFDVLEESEAYMATVGDIRFPRNKLSFHNAKRVYNSTVSRKNKNLHWAVDKIDPILHEQLTGWASKKGNLQSIDKLNVFIDWIIKRNANGFNHPIRSLEDVRPYDIYNPQKMHDTASFYHFINERKNSKGKKYALNTLRTQWATVNKIFDDWINVTLLSTGFKPAKPIPPTRDVFTNPNENATSRTPMDSALHDIVLEVATSDNYSFAKSQKGHFVKLFNYQTQQYEVVFNPQIARVLHLLLLIPVRGHSARWLDEGLLDDEIWDIESECYVKNTSYLANFLYEDGKRHVQRHGRTGILSSKSRQGNNSLSLYINTNKTKMRQLQKKGHTGYKIDWPYNTGVERIDEVYDIILAQKEWNKIYSPVEKAKPVKTLDEEASKYSLEDWEKLPYFVPLFRTATSPTVSAMIHLDHEKFSERNGLYLPPSAENVRNYFYAVMKEADKRFKERYPAYKNHCVAFGSNGKCFYDVHTLRVQGISDLLDNGVSLEVVQAIVGHATEVMTIYYHKIKQSEFRKIVTNAARKGGTSHINESDYLNYDDELISITDITNSFSGPEITDSNFDINGEMYKKRPLVLNGGVCFSYNCNEGGIKVTFKNGKSSAVIAPVDGGYRRCGNCRYWRSGPRFLLEQIFYLNQVGLELKELIEKRESLIIKAQSVYEDHSIENPEMLSLRYSKQCDEVNTVIALRATEYERRLKMMNASLAKLVESGELDENDLEKTSLMLIDDFELGVPEKLPLNKFDAMMEINLQGTVLGLNGDDITVEKRQLEQFYNKLSDQFSDTNPFLYLPSSSVKRAAMLIKLKETVGALGRTFTDEEYDDPRVLRDQLEDSQSKVLAKTLNTHNVSALKEKLEHAHEY